MAQTDAHIRTHQNQVIQYLTDNPEKAFATTKITGQVSDGLKCHVTQGRHEVDMDMGLAMGGDNTAPTPGFFAKAGVVGCLSIGTKMTAARLGIAVRSVRVELETDTDSLALLGHSGNYAGPLETRVNIVVDSDEDDAKIDGLIDFVLTIDTWFLALRDAQSVSTRWTRHRQAA